MTKAELLEAIKDAPDDAPVELFIFDEHVPIAFAYYDDDDCYDDDGNLDPSLVGSITLSWK